MIKNIAIDEALAKDNAIFIDVRSPQEFAEDALPFAYNIPLLDDEQRSRVGITYKHQGSTEARQLGMELIAGQIPEKIKKIKELAQGKELILYCWRGGMRSKAMCELLDLAGIPSYRLIGGYKAFRKHVNEFFSRTELSQQFFVIYGLTGVGKSEIIQRLQRLNVAAIDLEKLANHRGSVFGSVGLGDQPSQKKFETALYTALRAFRNEQAIVVEGESRKIGKLTIPALFFDAMQNGYRILVYDSLQNRIKRICQEYMQGPDRNLLALEKSLSFLQRRIGKVKVEKLTEQLRSGEYMQVVKDLLVNYYDVLYRHPDQPSAEYDLSVNSGNVEQAAEEIRRFIHLKSLGKGG